MAQAPKDLVVKCPGCGARLRVDSRSGEVLGSGDQPRPKDLSEVVQRVTERGGKVADVFASALEQERRRKQELEERFKQAQEKARQDPSEPERDFDDRWR